MDPFILLLLITAGAFINTLIGLGGGVIILAGLMLGLPPHLALPLHSFSLLSINSFRTGVFFKHIRWRPVIFYSAFLIPSCWLGGVLFNVIKPSWLNILVGMGILGSLIPVSNNSSVEPGDKTFLILGPISGFLSMFMGAVAPLVIPFFRRLKSSKDGLQSTKAAGMLALQISRLIAFGGATDISFAPLANHIAILVSGSLVGVLLAVPTGKKTPDRKFKLLINFLLFFVSMKLLYEGTKQIAEAN